MSVESIRLCITDMKRPPLNMPRLCNIRCTVRFILNVTSLSQFRLPRRLFPRSVATNIFTILATLTDNCNPLDASNLKTRNSLLKPGNSSSFSPEILNFLNVSPCTVPSTVQGTLCYALRNADISSSCVIRGSVSPPYKTDGIS